MFRCFSINPFSLLCFSYDSLFSSNRCVHLLQIVHEWIHNQNEEKVVYLEGVGRKMKTLKFHVLCRSKNLLVSAVGCYSQVFGGSKDKQSSEKREMSPLIVILADVLLNGVISMLICRKFCIMTMLIFCIITSTTRLCAIGWSK